MEENLGKKTLITVVAMLGAWTLLVGTLSLLTVLLVNRGTSATSSVDTDTHAATPTVTSPVPRTPREPANRLLKSATEI